MKKFADNIPIYLQLKLEVENAVLAGLLKAEDMAPSIRAMAASYSINPLTVSKAISELENEGIIAKKRGIGFFVTAMAQETIRRKRMQEYLENEVKSFVQKAAQLGIDLNEIVKLIKSTYEEVVSGNHHGNQKSE